MSDHNEDNQKQRYNAPEDNARLVYLQERRDAAKAQKPTRQGTYQPPALLRARKRLA